jgi:hypothetical protein
MAPRSPDPNAATGPWAGGFSGPGLSELGGAVIIAAELPDAGTGILVSYSGGRFTRQFWSAGPPVPQFIEVLSPEQIHAIKDQVAAQMVGIGSGLDDIPLRSFVETVRMYFEPDASERFTSAAFGSITEITPGTLAGELSWPGDVVGTVVGSADGVLAQSHLAHVAAADPVPLREADLESLLLALHGALANPAIDPLWQQMLIFAERAFS